MSASAYLARGQPQRPAAAGRSVPACVIFLLLCVRVVAGPDIAAGVNLGNLQNPSMDESSGLAVSRKNPRVLWVVNDSGPNSVYAINRQGEYLGAYIIDGFAMRDWEDIAIGPGPAAGVDYLYVGNIGDNSAVYGSISVARVPEPSVDADGSPETNTLYGADIITLQYPDGARDAEALMVDPWSGDICIVTKRELFANRVYNCPYPQSVTGTNTLIHVATLPICCVTAGDIAPSGRQILLKTVGIEGVRHWYRAPGQTVAQALGGTSTVVPYIAEPQGEAVAWRPHDGGYYTTSEGVAQPLYFYENLTDDDLDGILDGWEWSFFPDLARDGTGDADSDGVTDFDEYVADTSPTNGADYFRIAGSEVLTNGDVIIHWNSSPDRTYNVYRASAISSSWTNVMEAAGTGGRQSYTNSAGGAGPLFFKLGVHSR